MNRAKVQRVKARKTIAETAKCLGVSEDTVSRVEHEKRELSVNEACKLAVFFGCKETDFFPDAKGESANPPSSPSPEGGKKLKEPTVKRDRRKRIAAA